VATTGRLFLHCLPSVRKSTELSKRFASPVQVLRFAAPEPAGLFNQMKTTVEIASDFLVRAKGEAAATHTTLRSLIEEGLRELLARKALAKHKPIKPVTFRGRGLQPGFGGEGWDAIRDA